MARSSKNDVRVRIHERIRHRVHGTEERPRLAVFRSLKHIYAQVIDDLNGKTLVAASSLSAELKTKLKSGGNRAAAEAVGDLLAQRALAQGVKTVVFDRGGHVYHGRIKALAEAARKSGLQF